MTDVSGMSQLATVNSPTEVIFAEIAKKRALAMQLRVPKRVCADAFRAPCVRLHSNVLAGFGDVRRGSSPSSTVEQVSCVSCRCVRMCCVYVAFL